MPPYTPLLRPDRFFAEREFHALRLLAVSILLVFSLPLGVWGVGWVLRERIDGTVMVVNPNRPSEGFCEGVPASMDAGCDAPARIERNIDVVLSEAIGQFIGVAFLGVLLAVVLVAGLLHVGSWLLDGENGASASLGVALWGLVPTLLSLVFGIALLLATVEPTTVTPESDPAALTERLRADLRPIQRWGPLFSGLTTAWAGVIWRYGLLHKRGLTAGQATGVAGGVAVALWLLSLA